MVEGQQGLEEYRKDDSHQSLYVGVKRKISLVNVLLTNIIYTLTKKKDLKMLHSCSVFVAVRNV